jgi:hypothetical protein
MRRYLHQRVAELEQTMDALLATLHFPLLPSHGELGGHLVVQYQGVAVNHYNNRVSRRNFPHTDTSSSSMGTHCSIACKIISLRGFHINCRNACA